MEPDKLEVYDADVIGIRSGTKIPEEVLRRKRLAIAAYCIGTDQVDIPACEEMGTMVFHDRFSSGRSVAELVLCSMIGLSRRLGEHYMNLHSGKWEKFSNNCHVLVGKHLGVVGFGNIGLQLANLAEGMGMEVSYFDLEERASHGKIHCCATMDELLACSDFVTLHVDGRKGNRNFFGAKRIFQMKEGSYFLNMSRGFVVDEVALAEALRSGYLGGAALDVHAKEPKNGERFQSPLIGLPNFLPTPHIGGSTEEAQKDIAISTTRRVLAYLNEGYIQQCPSFINRTFVTPRLPNAHRIIWIHENAPEMMRKVDGMFAKYGINIDGQFLMTNERIGYAVYDVFDLKGHRLDVERRLKRFRGSFVVRIL